MISVPETKGKSLEQIELLFNDKHEWQVSEVEMGDAENLVQKEQGSEVEMGDAENLVQKE